MCSSFPIDCRWQQGLSFWGCIMFMRGFGIEQLAPLSPLRAQRSLQQTAICVMGVLMEMKARWNTNAQSNMAPKETGNGKGWVIKCDGPFPWIYWHVLCSIITDWKLLKLECRQHALGTHDCIHSCLESLQIRRSIAYKLLHTYYSII